MIDDPDEICPERTKLIGHLIGNSMTEQLPHLLVRNIPWWRQLLPKRWWYEYRCLYCGERAR